MMLLRPSQQRIHCFLQQPEMLYRQRRFYPTASDRHQIIPRAIQISFYHPADDRGKKQVLLKPEVPDSITLKEVIEESAPLKMFSEIDLNQRKVGIFVKPTKPDAVVDEDSRVEIYRTITADPETVIRRDW